MTLGCADAAGPATCAWPPSNPPLRPGMWTPPMLDGRLGSDGIEWIAESRELTAPITDSMTLFTMLNSATHTDTSAWTPLFTAENAALTMFLNVADFL